MMPAKEVHYYIQTKYKNKRDGTKDKPRDPRETGCPYRVVYRVRQK